MALAKDRSTFYNGHFENGGESSGHQKLNYHQPDNETLSLISFMHSNGGLISFDQNDHFSVLEQSRTDHSPKAGFVRTRLGENFNCVQNSSFMDDAGMEDDAFAWPNPEEASAIDCFQEVETEDAGFRKRPNLGESTQAYKKQCTNGAKKGKQKSPQSSKDPQSIAAKNRRERISERLKILQDLVPNGSKVDLVTMLEKAISYVKFLQLQVKVLATDELWPVQGGKAPKLSQVKEAIDAILASQRERNSRSK